jgi:hypothetical protein
VNNAHTRRKKKNAYSNLKKFPFVATQKQKRKFVQNLAKFRTFPSFIHVLCPIDNFPTFIYKIIILNIPHSLRSSDELWYHSLVLWVIDVEVKDVGDVEFFGYHRELVSVQGIKGVTGRKLINTLHSHLKMGKLNHSPKVNIWAFFTRSAQSLRGFVY